MATINIKTEIRQLNTQHKFLVLGDDSFLKHPDNSGYVSKKLTKSDKTYNDKFWGTLGYFDNSRIDWDGELNHSTDGNFDIREGVTDELKQVLVEATGENELSKADIRERYISFDKVSFPDKSLQKTLRLTLFLDSEEGAVVFYQHYDKNEFNEDVTNHKGFDYDFIFPEATKNDAGLVDFNTDKRDRLLYEIDILPNEIFTELEDNDLITKLRFVIKILTFKRKAQSNESIIEKAEERIFKTDKKYKLMVFNIENDEFVIPTQDEYEIDPSKKTLFLIHGTFADTASSYDAILSKKVGAQSLLKQYLLDNNNPHKQAIAFNHQTMFDDAEENTEQLMKLLDNYKQGFVFKNSLDLIGTSRGALVAKYLAIEHERNLGNNPKIPVDKIITVSGANGCGYLTKGKTYINTLLKILNKGSLFQKILVTLAQVSVAYITSRKGLELMKPGSSRLDYILNYPVSSSVTDVLTLSADFQIVKGDGIGKKIKNFLLRIGDRIAQTMLGKQHDFVIGTIEQQIADPYSSIYLPDNKLFNAIHGQVLGKPGAWNLVVKYLKM